MAIIIMQNAISDFEQWKENFKNQINLMKSVINVAEQNEKLESLEKELLRIERQIDDLEVTPDYVYYAEGNERISVGKSLIEVGFYLGRYWDNINVNADDKFIVEVMNKNKTELLKIFISMFQHS